MTDARIPVRFPRGFLIGASTSPHQVEGGNVHSDFWVIERSPQSAIDQPSGDACDRPLPTRSRAGEPVTPGSRHGLMPGSETTYQSYGRPWANVSTTPFREYKHWVHEGGISAPFIIHWPDGLPGDAMQHAPAHLPDVFPTLLEAAGATYPATRAGRAIPPLEGRSLLPHLRGEPVLDRPMFWEHEGNAGVRRGECKLVRKFGHDWELYSIANDRAERHDLAPDRPDIVAELGAAYGEWAVRCGVIPRERVLELYRERGNGLPES